VRRVNNGNDAMKLIQSLGTELPYQAALCILSQLQLHLCARGVKEEWKEGREQEACPELIHLAAVRNAQRSNGSTSS
jgi:hypothetical protein